MNDINFTLTHQEIKDAIKLTGRTKQRFTVCFGHTAMALVALLFVGYRLYRNPTNIFFYVLLVVGLGVLAYTWLRLWFELSKVVSESADRPVTVKFLGEKISFCFLDSDCTIVDMASSPKIFQNEEIFVVMANAQSMIVLPKKHLNGGMVELLARKDFENETNHSDNDDNAINEETGEKNIEEEQK